MELTVTGTNAITSPFLHAWDWRVALYLFLGGMAAGLAVMSSILRLKNDGKSAEGESASFWGPLWVPIILSFGMLFIFWDLDRKLNVYWLYLTFKPFSPMSWGSWGLLLFFPVCALNALVAMPGEYRHWLKFDVLRTLVGRLQPYLRLLAILNFVFGIFVGIYTGVLLSAFVARPFWHSALLPVLCLVSALTAGAAFMAIIASRKAVKLFFTKVNVWIVATELIVMVLFSIGLATSQGGAVMPSFSFILEYLLYGLAIALVAKLLLVTDERSDALPDRAVLLMQMSAAMVLAGGLMFRISLVYTGQLSHLV